MSTVEDTTVSFSLEINVQQAYTEIRRLQTVLYRTLGILQQMGLPPEVNETIERIQKTIAALNSLRLTIMAFYASTGPIGWALALISLVGTAVAVETAVTGWAEAASGAVDDVQRQSGGLPPP